MTIAFAAAFVGCELVLYAATILLASGSGAFTAAIVARIAAINAVALLALLGPRRAALILGLPIPATFAHA